MHAWPAFETSRSASSQCSAAGTRHRRWRSGGRAAPAGRRRL